MRRYLGVRVMRAACATAAMAQDEVARQPGEERRKLRAQASRALGAPDSWEQEILIDCVRRVANGERAAGLEISEIVGETQGRLFRYPVAMPVEPPCRARQDKQESLSPTVKARRSIDDPFDRATGLTTGQVYGIVAIEQPLR